MTDQGMVPAGFIHRKARCSTCGELRMVSFRPGREHDGPVRCHRCGTMTAQQIKEEAPNHE
jgi:hypothetical protein